MSATKSAYNKPGFFHMWVKDYEISVQVLRRPTDVVFLADERLKGSQHPRRQETFSSAVDALRFLGYPVDFLGVPSLWRAAWTSKRA